ncbi:MAG TPA: hypothetical protein VGA50_14630 [Kiloniellales bacterium]
MFTIFEGDDEWSGTIGPSETLTDLCTSGCSIALNDEDEETDFRGYETVMIIDGKLTLAE